MSKVPPGQPAPTTSPVELAAGMGSTSLQCQNCQNTWPYTTSLPAPGGPIGILFHLVNLGCPVCKTIQPFKAVVPPAVP